MFAAVDLKSGVGWSALIFCHQRRIEFKAKAAVS
jgi:hypothetical protein